MQLLRNVFIITVSFLSVLTEPSLASDIKVKINDVISVENIKILDLKTAGRIALKDSPTIKAAHERIISAKQKYKQVKAGYLPKIDLVCSTLKNNMSDTDYEKSNLQASLLGSHISNPVDYYSTQLSVKWLLFDGFQRKFSIDAANSAVSISKYGQKDITRNLLYAVSKAYFSAQLAKEKIEITKADGLFYQRLFEDANARKIAGTGSLSDVLSFEVRLNTANAESIVAEQEYSARLSRLAILLGIKSAEIPETTKLADLTYGYDENFQTKEIKSLIESAFNNRPDILQYKYSIDRAAAEVKIARGQLLPVVWVEGLINGRRERNAKIDKEDIGDSVALKFSYNIFSGGSDRAGIRKAKAGRLAKEYEYKHLKMQICSDVKNSLNKLKSAIKTYKLYKLNASLVQQNRDLVKIEYSAGKCSLVRLNESQRDLSMIKSREALALVTIFQSKSQLEAYTGEILNLF